MDIDSTLSARSGSTSPSRSALTLVRGYRPRLTSVVLVALGLLVAPLAVQGWNNGPAGNASTNKAAECSTPPYSTHDWVADHDLAPVAGGGALR
jgi:hypothetical protein